MVLLSMVNAFNICVVGPSSDLGKELVYQCIKNQNYTVLGLTSNKKPVTVPFTGNSFTKKIENEIFTNKNLVIENYWKDISRLNYDNIVFTTSGGPFEHDYSDKLMIKILSHLPECCNSIHLVSAYGVGDSLKPSELGINIMNSWYLKDVYRAKNNQEMLLNDYKRHIKKIIYRPKALSYGDTTIPSISRRDLAANILNNINNINEKID